MLRYVLHGWLLLGFAGSVVIGLSGHDLVQAWGARLLGDSRAVREGFGRPGRAQIDPLGIVTTVLTYGAFGWAAPVPMEVRFRRQRARASVALLLGPAYLFALALGAAALRARTQIGSDWFEVWDAAVVCCAGLLVLSLAPFPPLALGRVLWMYAPTTPGWQRARYLFEEESIGSLIAFAFLVLPLMFTPLPDVVGTLGGHLVNGLSDLVGRPSFPPL